MRGSSMKNWQFRTLWYSVAMMISMAGGQAFYWLVGGNLGTWILPFVWGVLVGLIGATEIESMVEARDFRRDMDAYEREWRF